MLGATRALALVATLLVLTLAPTQRAHAQPASSLRDATGGAGPSSASSAASAQSGAGSGSGLGGPLGQILGSAPGQFALQYGLGPLGQTVKCVLPNAYQGATTDLTNGYYMLAEGANKGFGALSSNFASAGDNLVSRYHSMQASLVESLQEQLARQDALIKQMYEMVANPEQLCKDLAKQTKETAQQASAMAQQAGQQSSSFMNKWMGK